MKKKSIFLGIGVVAAVGIIYFFKLSKVNRKISVRTEPLVNWV